MTKSNKPNLAVRRTVAIGMAALAIPAATATVALAASVTGDGTLVGSTGADFITAGTGPDTVWGLGGGDNIKAGNGNDVIDADGKCSGVNPGDYPNGLGKSQYCSHQVLVESATSSITAGDGSDVIYGGGGPNNIKVGNGPDTVYGGFTSDNIIVGDGHPDVIHNGSGPLTAKTGSGGGTIYANNGQKNYVTCMAPNSYTVYATTKDVVKGCATVKYTSPRVDAHLIGVKTSTRKHAVKPAAHKRSGKKTGHKRASKRSSRR